MDAARIPIVDELGQHVIFVVQRLRSDGNWAYLQAVPHQPDGQALNWLTTPYASDWRADAMSDIVMILLRRIEGNWRVLEYIIGPTDVFWVSWMHDYALPHALFSD